MGAAFSVTTLVLFGAFASSNKTPFTPKDAFLRIKRLKQLKDEGLGYQDYLSQASRVTNEEQREKIVNYKHEQEEVEALFSKLKISFLPDCSVNETARWFYPTLYSNLSSIATFPISTYFDMPNVFEFNTKRFEIQWLNYMRSLKLDDYDVVIAHGSSAEACLRYLESDQLNSCLLVDASDLYTAGERHGRAFHYSSIANNCKLINFLATTKSSEGAMTTFRQHIQQDDDDDDLPVSGKDHSKITIKILQKITAEFRRISTHIT